MQSNTLNMFMAATNSILYHSFQKKKTINVNTRDILIQNNQQDSDSRKQLYISTFYENKIQIRSILYHNNNFK
jgi:hypothetical protein